MRIALISVFVEDQDTALSFYVDVLGFVPKLDIPAGDYRWLTVASAEQTDGPELLLEPNANPIARDYQAGLFAAGIPIAAFAVDDVDEEYRRLSGLGVVFRSEPRISGGAIFAIFEDTCGNLIQIYQQTD